MLLPDLCGHSCAGPTSSSLDEQSAMVLGFECIHVRLNQNPPPSFVHDKPRLFNHKLHTCPKNLQRRKLTSSALANLRKQISTTEQQLSIATSPSEKQKLEEQVIVLEAERKAHKVDKKRLLARSAEEVEAERALKKERQAAYTKKRALIRSSLNYFKRVNKFDKVDELAKQLQDLSMERPSKGCPSTPSRAGGGGGAGDRNENPPTPVQTPWRATGAMSPRRGLTPAEKKERYLEGVLRAQIGISDAILLNTQSLHSNT